MKEPEKSKIIALLMDFEAGVFKRKEMPDLIDSILSAPSVPDQRKSREEILEEISARENVGISAWGLKPYKLALQAMTTYADQEVSAAVEELEQSVVIAAALVEAKDKDIKIYRSALGYPVEGNTPFILTNGTPVFNGIAHSLDQQLTAANQTIAEKDMRIAELEKELEFKRLY